MIDLLHDVLLDEPFGGEPFRAILFASFALHFVFVLLTLGAALLGVVHLVRRRWGPTGADHAWHDAFLRPFFVYKSLAIVLGVGPLLLMTTGHAVPTGTATSLLAPLWMLLVPFLLGALVLVEVVTEGARLGPTWRAVLGVAGLTLLLAVPGTFAAFVVTLERPAVWGEMLARGGQLPPGLSGHWLARWLHVIGAAIVTTAAFQYLRDRTRHPERAPVLVRLVAAGALVQVVLGVALYATLDAPPGALVDGVVVAAVVATASLLWTTLRPRDGRLPSPRALVALVLLVVLPMLLARQLLQDRRLLPFERALEARAAERRLELAPFATEALEDHEIAESLAYDNGLTIYSRSCAFCHGAVANGQGYDAHLLRVPPADLTTIRASRAALVGILRRGVRGTAMPSFGAYTPKELDSVLDVLSSAGLSEPTPMGATGADRTAPPPAPRYGEQAAFAATRTWATTCGVCHGVRGEGSELGRTLSPPPPDLTTLTFTPQRLFEVVTHGYPGTRMPAFASLDVAARWALVDLVRGFYAPSNGRAGE